jgi:hypothetical protein
MNINILHHQFINVLTAGVQAFLIIIIISLLMSSLLQSQAFPMDYPQWERAITHHAHLDYFSLGSDVFLSKPLVYGSLSKLKKPI